MRNWCEQMSSLGRLVAGAVMALTAVAVGCSRHSEQPPVVAASAEGAAADEVMVTVQPVTLRNVQRRVGVLGTLHGYEELSLAAKVQGRVIRISHDVADRVAPGEALLEIDPTDYKLSLRQAERALQVELAKLGLPEVPSPSVDLTKIPTIVQARLRCENAEKRLARSKQLVAKKASPEEDLTEKTSEYRVAQAEYDNQLMVARAGIAAIQVKQEALAIARQQLDDTVVRVPEPSQPIPGVEGAVAYAVTVRNVAEGSYVSAGTEVFTIVIERPLKFRGRVPERRSGEVAVGQQAQVYAAAFDTPFPGAVSRINPSVDMQTRAFEVEILVPNAEGKLKPGGFAKTAILTQLDDQAATVPLEALVHFAGVTKIFLVDGGHAREVQVTLGVQDTNWVEIATPKLPAGSQVVTSGQTAIADGTAVAIRASGAAPAAAIGEEEHRSQGEAAAGPMARREAAP